MGGIVAASFFGELGAPARSYGNVDQLGVEVVVGVSLRRVRWTRPSTLIEDKRRQIHLPLEVAGVVLALSFISLFRSYRSGNLTAMTVPDVQASLTGEPVK